MTKVTTKRIFSISIAILLFIGALFVYASLIKPLYGDIKTQRAKLASREEVKKQLGTAVEKIQKIAAEYQDIGLLQETISSILPVDQAVPQAIAQIVGLAENNGLLVQSLTSRQMAIQPSSASKIILGLGTVRFDVRLIGSYEAFKGFLKQLETNIRLMDVADFKMDPVSKTEKNIFFYNVTMDAYYQTD